MTSETSRYSTCDIMDQSILAAEEAEENYACLSELAAIRKPRYKLLDLLGKGPCGRVFKARNTYSNHIVAVKVIETNDREWVSREGDALFEIKKEVRRVNSSSAYGSFGLLEVLDVVPFLDTLWMVSPLCTNGSLKTLLDQQGPLSDIYIISVMRDAGRGLFWLHSQDTFHGNVKAANILINEKGSIRLCDFDIVIRGEVSPSHSESAYHGSLHWLAPECLVDRHGSHKGMDIWSFGALAYELATGSPPYATLHDATTILHHLERFGVPTLTGDHYSGGLKDLLSYCFVVDASRRPCMNLVFSHSYLSSTAVSASILDIVNKYLEWEDQQSVHHPQEANQSSSAADNTEFEAQVTGEQTGDLPEKPGSEIPEMNQPETAKVSLKEDPLSESEGELSTWSVVDEPSRCSSPFDLEHILLRTRTLSLEDIEAIEAVDASYLPQDHPQSRYARGNHKDASVEDASNPGDVPITVGMSISQGEINALSNIVSSPAETSAGGLDMDFNVVFNPGFDVFASQPVDCNSSWNTFQGAPRLYAHAPSENTARNSNSLWAPPAPIPCHWQTPPVSPSSSPSRTAADHSLAVVPAADNLRVRHLPPTSPSRYEGPLRSAVEAEVAPNDNDDDDDTSTLRARDSNPVNLEQAAAAAPRTPPTTPNQMVQSKGKEPASSPHAWPPYNLPNRSTNNIPLQILSPPPTPAILKPLPPLPKPKAHSSTSQHRPSTSGGSSSGRLARYDLAPPVPSVPGPVRRPSLDIFSAVSYDSFGPSFDGNGNYIAPPAPLSPTRPFGALAIPTTQANTLAPRPKGKSPVLVRERMIPREAGSCPPRRRKSHPPTKPASTNRGATSSSSSHVPTPSSSSTSSSSASRSKIKPPPRNASFSVFPTSQSSSLAAAAQAATKARNLAISGSSGDGGINLAALPPRRPSAPLPTTQRSFFDYDADEDSDSEEYEIVRGGAADFKKGVKRIVNSVSANLGDTIRGLETAPRKGFRWMKRSSP